MKGNKQSKEKARKTIGTCRPHAVVDKAFPNLLSCPHGHSKDTGAVIYSEVKEADLESRI